MTLSLPQQCLNYINAGYSAFFLHTSETSRVQKLLTEISQQKGFAIREFDLAYGKLDDYRNISAPSPNPSEIIESILDSDFENEIIYLRSIKGLLEHNPLALSRLRHLIEKITYQHKHQCILVLQDSERYLPAEIEPFITLIEMPLPTQEEIKQIIQRQQLKIDSSFAPTVITALSGLNELEIEQLLKLIRNRFGVFDQTSSIAILEIIQHQKEQIIAKSGVLEMVKISQSIDDIGGLQNLKDWVKEQAQVLSRLEEAKAFGVKPPKGTLIAGMPGCGKSLTAKATAALFKQPLLRLDIGSLLGKYMGESEGNMRKALAMAESISPCVLWVDELEKAFVGINNEGSNEVSSRLLGYFLTWLQEKTAPVFIVATANDITKLPPELLRKGRFDEIFYVGFPNTNERKKILEIHLNNAKQNVANFNLTELAQLCRDYSGADIENAVYEGVRKAFVKGEKQLATGLLEEVIKNTIPLRKTLKDKVGEYEKKFDELYLTNASLADGLSIAQMIKMAKDTNYLERIKVAQSEDVTEEILEELAKDKELEVRKAVFTNPNCSAQVLNEQLSLSEKSPLYNIELQNIVIRNPNTSFELIWNKFKNEEKRKDIIVHVTNNRIKISNKIIDYFLSIDSKENTDLRIAITRGYILELNDSDYQNKKLEIYLTSLNDRLDKCNNYIKEIQDVITPLLENVYLPEECELKLISLDTPDLNKLLDTDKAIFSSFKKKIGLWITTPIAQLTLIKMDINNTTGEIKNLEQEMIFGLSENEWLDEKTIIKFIRSNNILHMTIIKNLLAHQEFKDKALKAFLKRNINFTLEQKVEVNELLKRFNVSI